ncbi:MAG: AAA family ATPase [Nitrososphaerota archaeon]|nr:ATP-binding protein [Nitrososphaerota archaeon]MDG6927281.1 AAA family ATPase [Nitrososphaerota archaeon]MDG6930361.1 AAA family ATPase [Nitrososphaerota archaeon]MDG6931717.1 AAA family ATPase [Nitrososphaerota archaeon]MDG6936765.1 AAA family ATPase [Nitrososphaerota archaeon]
MENFLSVSDEVKLSNIRDINLITGPNNAGKTNLIRAVELLVSRYGNAGPTQTLLDYHYNRYIDAPFRIEAYVSLEDDEKKAMINSMTCTLVASLGDQQQTNLKELISKYPERITDIIRGIIGPLFEDVSVFVEGSASLYYAPKY